MATDPTVRVPAAPPPVPRGNPVHPVPEAVWWEDVRRRLRTLANAVSLALVVAVVALGIALWALLGGTDDDTGASRERVSMLDDRVERLEAARRSGASRDALAAVQQQQRVLADRLAALTQPSDDVDSLQTAIDATRQAVDQLNHRLTALEQRSP